MPTGTQRHHAIRHKVLPDIALNTLAIGGETGEMDKMLSKVADFYDDEVDTMIKALTSKLEPAMIMLGGRNRGFHSAGDVPADVHRV